MSPPREEIVSTRNTDVAPISPDLPTPIRVSLIPRNKSWIHAWADTGSKLFQIAALIAAGAWAWIGFQQSVAPSLEIKMGVNSELHWAVVPGTQVCQASFQVKVNNAGKTPFEVEKATVTAWILDLQQNGLLPTDPSKPTLIDPANANKGEPSYNGDGGPISADVSGHYAEGVENSGAVDVFFKYQPHAIVIFLATIEGKQPSSYWPIFAREIPTQSYTYQTDQVCGASWDTHVLPAAPIVPKARPR